MEKYRLVQEHKGDGDDFLEPTASCEVRITQQGKPRNYISYSMGLFVSSNVDVFVLRYVCVSSSWSLFSSSSSSHHNVISDSADCAFFFVLLRGVSYITRTSSARVPPLSLACLSVWYPKSLPLSHTFLNICMYMYDTYTTTTICIYIHTTF